ncbi:MAG: nucleotidyltransferase family protein [Paludibacterium sp.]|uniref:nucleotidyltransferase family protein n=1 Tax=Paludibacterium sp. TaxID=1917523 RepID=UPI0025D59DE9|nr:nucleotidyltransferase family protein [Paludibacterium sp.]MBV8047220.1 nucleotidyltransferase family protein [Paludibacterium sp.]MBV8467930.1 nucleotidyltransferase family protein [Burkholderiales bacterium]
MKSWQAALVGPDVSLREALEIIDSAGTQLAMVVDANRRLLGTVSDGDARRALLGGLSMNDSVLRVMHAGATTVADSAAPSEILSTMRRTGRHQLPIVSASNEVVGLALIADYLTASRRENWVVIMAGGLGTRLKELTRETPKPMLKIGSRPLLETIIRSYADQGFHRFYLAVNYKAEQIEAHFGNGSSLGVEIRYLREEQRLGTAGALSLLTERPTMPFIVTNADLLTKEDHGSMLDRHVESGAQATMAVRHYEMQVPFGVVRLHEGAIERIEEKPIQRFVVSAGIYALSPEIVDLVPQGEFFDMPALFEKMLDNGMHTRAHQIDGYWLDIGRLPDFERANSEFHDIFN